jgi:hypothetical protein
MSLELTPHGREEVVIPDWLRQKGHLRRYQPHVHELGREAAHEDDWKGGMQPGQRGCELPAIHYRHPQVGQHQADLLVGAVSEQLERTRAIRSFEDGVAFILKQTAYDAPHAVLILHHEYGFSWLSDWAPAVHVDSARAVVEPTMLRP